MKEIRFRFGTVSSRVIFQQRIEPEDLAAPGGVLTVFDTHTWRLFGRSRVSRAAGSVVLPAGERSKTWRGAGRVLSAAARRGLGRDGLIAGIGGGVVCDLAAFCASLYMRGCSLTLVPTTLLAMVDAALGGKTGVDLPGAKNMAGTFYPAGEIRIVPAALASLPDRELRSGLAEAAKNALLGDADLLATLERGRGRLLDREPDLLEDVVERCIRVKGAVVEEDFREQGRRAILNLGHTFGHALEAATGFRRYTHGEAVAWGLKMALRLGERLGVTPPEHARRVERLLESYGFDLHPWTGAPEKLLAAMQADKKKREGRLRFVLQRGVGDTLVQPVEEERVWELLAAERRPPTAAPAGRTGDGTGS
jgi:3-dehydroquinate synthase